MKSINKDTQGNFLTQILPQRKSLVTIQSDFRLRDYIDKNGKQLIYAHLTAFGNRERISTDLKIKAKDWNFKDNMPKSYMADEILILQDIKAKFYSIIKRYRLNDQFLTIESLMYEYKTNLSGTDFIQFCWKIWEDERKVIAQSTSKRYESVIKKIQRYKNEIPFSIITYEFIKGFENHLIKLGNNQQTIASNLKCLKKYLTEADRYGINIPVNLDDIKINQVRSRRQGIKPDELKILFEYYQSSYISKRYKLSLGYFLFSCFTSLRVSDILRLNRKDIKENFVLHTQKSKKYVTINLTSKSKCCELISNCIFT